jgi:hypothetical protein
VFPPSQKSSRQQPRRSLRCDGGSHDAADHGAVGDHVVIVIAPLVRRCALRASACPLWGGRRRWRLRWPRGRRLRWPRRQHGATHSRLWPPRRRRETRRSYTYGTSSGTAVTFMTRPTTAHRRRAVVIFLGLADRRAAHGILRGAAEAGRVEAAGLHRCGRNSFSSGTTSVLRAVFASRDGPMASAPALPEATVSGQFVQIFGRKENPRGGDVLVKVRHR